MTGFAPVALYGLEVPAGDILIPAAKDFPAHFRITMAAINPDEKIDAADSDKPRRSTLRLIKTRMADIDDEDDDLDDETMKALLAASDDEDDDEANGGPSNKKAKAEALAKLMQAAQDEEDEDEEMEDAKPAGKKGSKGKAQTQQKSKGKGKAMQEESESEPEDESEVEDDMDNELEEFVVCTLDTERNFQQPIDIHVSEGEEVFFVVSGTHTVYLTGNYLVDLEEEESDDDEDEDYEDDSDLDGLEYDDGEESDDLDDLANPRVTELSSDEEGDEEAPALVETKKGKKRTASDEDLDAQISKEGAKGKKQQQQQSKKQKNNKGEPVKADETKAEDKKKVQFAKQLEQGPTGSTKKDDSAAKPALGKKVVQGVTIDDRKIGTGRVAKAGDAVGMRYIGKLDNGKVFDANKKGKPFSFKLGKGEVIKGWDIGVAGMAVGGERRLIIPAKLAYGNKALPGIPANSTLTFDVKLLEIK